jgi:hypothetical protein
MKLRSLAVAAVLAAGLLAPSGAGAVGTPTTNPFGQLSAVVTPPSGTTPGSATLTIDVDTGTAFGLGSTIYFGLRLMGTEDMQLTQIVSPAPASGCTISDFAGNNTTGKWQGAPIFSAGSGAANARMRMVGGFIKKSCGDIVLKVSFQTQPLIVYYAAFYGYSAAPWHDNYGTAPWNVVPTGGNPNYNEWWNLWGTFTELGYSNACTYTSTTETDC